MVMVMAVDKREDGIVYRSAVARIANKASALASAVKNRLKG